MVRRTVNMDACCVEKGSLMKEEESEDVPVEGILGGSDSSYLVMAQIENPLFWVSAVSCISMKIQVGGSVSVTTFTR